MKAHPTCGPEPEPQSTIHPAHTSHVTYEKIRSSVISTMYLATAAAASKVVGSQRVFLLLLLWRLALNPHDFATCGSHQRKKRKKRKEKNASAVHAPSWPRIFADRAVFVQSSGGDAAWERVCGVLLPCSSRLLHTTEYIRRKVLLAKVFFARSSQSACQNKALYGSYLRNQKRTR